MSRTLFIHIPKNAGTTIKNNLKVVSVSEKYISKNRLEQMALDPFHYNTLGKSKFYFAQHTPYNYLEKDMISSFDRTFAVVRNPWSRLVSLYNYAQGETMKGFQGLWYYKDPISWESFLDRMDSFRMTPNYYWKTPYDHWGSQSDWVVDRGKIKVDILRYENLSSDIEKYFGQPYDLPYMNQGKKVDYRTYYTEEQKQKVADWFRTDIAYWGFSFESEATKNYWTP